MSEKPDTSISLPPMSHNNRPTGKERDAHH